MSPTIITFKFEDNNEESTDDTEYASPAVSGDVITNDVIKWELWRRPSRHPLLNLPCRFCRPQRLASIGYLPLLSGYLIIRQLFGIRIYLTCWNVYGWNGGGRAGWWSMGGILWSKGAIVLHSVIWKITIFRIIFGNVCACIQCSPKNRKFSSTENDRHFRLRIFCGENVHLFFSTVHTRTKLSGPLGSYPFCKTSYVSY